MIIHVYSDDVVTIYDYGVGSDAHDLFRVEIYSHAVETLVTTSPSMVDAWIADVERAHRRRLHRLVVGLDAEWRPSFTPRVRNPVATLQLCVGRRCLVFQLAHARGGAGASAAPQSLRDFLAEESYTFVGVGVEDDAQKLAQDYGLWVRNAVDLGDLAAREYGDRRMKNKGLVELARIVHGMEIEKPREVTLSRWDNRRLSYDQVRYACADAYVSFMIGKKLIQ